MVKWRERKVSKKVAKKAASNNGTRLTKEQREAKIQEARERELKAKEKEERSKRLKKVGIIAVSVVLVAGLMIPTVALSVLGA